MEVQADELQVRHAREASDRLARVVEREAELGIGLAGRDRVVRVAGHTRGDPDQDLLLAAERGGHPLEPGELVE